MKFKKGPKTNAVGWTQASVSATKNPDESIAVATKETALVVSDSDETSIMARDDDDVLLEGRISDETYCCCGVRKTLAEG